MSSHHEDTVPLSAEAGPTLPWLLLPELAQLAWLEDLTLVGKEGYVPMDVTPSRFIYGGLPAEWGQPGAFPRLQR